MDEASGILETFYPGIGEISSLKPGGGTAGRCWHVTTKDGEYLLRRRGKRTSAPADVARDHRLRAFLMDNGIPTTYPVEAISGHTFATGRDAEGGGCFVYELHPYVRGRFMKPDSDAELLELAKILAHFHKCARSFKFDGPSVKFSQFAAVMPDFARPGTRLDDPAEMLRILTALKEQQTSKEDLARFSPQMNLVAALLDDYGNVKYAPVANGYIHGDLNLTNVLFNEDGKLVGLFDYDWSMPGAPIRDVADAIHFFAGGLPGGCDSGNIWELTSLPRFDERRTRLFLKEYTSQANMTDGEIRLIPQAWKARWLAFHIEGMAKVPQKSRIDFLTRNLPEFLCLTEKLDALCKSGL